MSEDRGPAKVAKGTAFIPLRVASSSSSSRRLQASTSIPVSGKSGDWKWTTDSLILLPQEASNTQHW
jgi:hypothetical protein